MAPRSGALTPFTQLCPRAKGNPLTDRQSGRGHIAARVAFAIIALAIAGCSTTVHGPNEELVRELPAIGGVTRTDTIVDRYCGHDSCPNGEEHENIRLVYRVDDPRVTQDEIVDRYSAALDEFVLVTRQLCREPRAADCPRRPSLASFRHGRAWVVMNFDGWNDGTYEVSVDTDSDR